MDSHLVNQMVDISRDHGTRSDDCPVTDGDSSAGDGQAVVVAGKVGAHVDAVPVFTLEASHLPGPAPTSVDVSIK